MLMHGSSIRSISDITGSSANTISKLLIDAGKACSAYHDATVRNVNSKRVQVDEIWSFTYAKAKNVARAKAAPEYAGDTWTWTALDADSKLIISWLVGGARRRLRHRVHAGLGRSSCQPRATDERRLQGVPLGCRGCVRLGYRLRHAGQTLRGTRQRASGDIAPPSAPERRGCASPATPTMRLYQHELR